MPQSDLNMEGRERILVIRLSSLGDLLLTAPALRVLRKRFPDHQIDLLVSEAYADAATLLPGPDRILTLKKGATFGDLLALRKTLSRRYSLLIDLQNSFRSAFLRATIFPTIWTKANRYRIRRWLLVQFKWNLYKKMISVPLRYVSAVSLVGGVDDGGGLHLEIPEAAKEWANHFRQEKKLEQRLIALCPGSRHFTKQWPTERWCELGRELRRQGFSVIVVGSTQESEPVNQVAQSADGAVPVVGYSIPEVAAILSMTNAVVSNDSGLMHLAVGVGAPVIAIFGPTVEEFGFYPFRAKGEVLSHDLSCRPCSALGGNHCPKTHFRCMLDTTCSDVKASLNKFVSKIS